MKAVYDDIMITQRTDYINRFWKALAHDPATLRRTWESIKQVMAPGALVLTSRRWSTWRSPPAIQSAIASPPTPPRPARQACRSRAVRRTDGVVGMADETNRLVTGYEVAIDERYRT